MYMYMYIYIYIYMPFNFHITFPYNFSDRHVGVRDLRNIVTRGLLIEGICTEDSLHESPVTSFSLSYHSMRSDVADHGTTYIGCH